MQLFHLSFEDNLPNVLVPRQPAGSDSNDVTHFTYEDLPARVSFAPSIEQCWYAIYANISKYFEKFQYPYMDMYVYMPTATSLKNCYMLPEEVTSKKIHDWHITKEVCFTDSVSIVKVGKIRIYSEEPNIRAVMYHPFNDKSKPLRFLAPEILYYVLEKYGTNTNLSSTGYHLYHYSEKMLTTISTKRKLGNIPPDLIRTAESRAKDLGDIGCYLDHISFFLEPIPVDILPKLFGGNHPFYKPGRKIVEHVVAVKLTDKMKWSLQETPEIGNFSDRWNWDDISKETRRTYIRNINKEMYRRNLQGTDLSIMFNAIRPYLGRTEEYFIKARSSKWAEDTATQYAAEVPHLMLYPDDGVMPVLNSKTVTLGLSSAKDITKQSFISRFFK